jgi:predicted dehydrogenase
MAKDKIRIGMIGTGQIGKHHISRYKEIPEAEIVALCDVRVDEAKKVAETLNNPTIYGDYQEMLKRDDIDSVDVCLHNRFHAPMTIAALQAGKNVYCEKPMSWAYAEAKAMYDMAKKLGKMLHIQLSTIYSPEARAAKKLITEGHLGKLYYAKACHYRRRGRPYVDGYGTPQFVQRETSGGGAMLDMAVYHISRILWLLDNPEVKAVSGMTYQMTENMYEDRRVGGKYSVEEFGMGLIRLAGGVTFLMEEAWAINADQPDGDHIMGSKGGVRLEPFGYYTTLGDMEMDGTFDLKQADWRWHQCIPNTAGYDDSQRHWIWAQLGRIPLLDTAGIALNTAFITEGVYLSKHYGREVTAEEIGKAEPGLGR